MRILITVGILLSLSSCAVYDAWDICETIRKGDEVRFTYPPPTNPISDEISVRHVPLPKACEHLRATAAERGEWNPETESYPRNTAWENCMQVGPK